MNQTNIYYVYKDKVDSSKIAKECLKHYCKDDNEEIILIRDGYRKPHTNKSGVYISISHTDKIWICVISGVPVGIDIERRDTFIDRDAFSGTKLFNEIDISMWTKLESCSKLMGKGLLESIDLLIDYINSNYFCFREVEIKLEYICTVCMVNIESNKMKSFNIIEL